MVRSARSIVGLVHLHLQAYPINRGNTMYAVFVISYLILTFCFFGFLSFSRYVEAREQAIAERLLYLMILAFIYTLVL